MTRIPSKHISLERLKQIKKDNYIAESGIEYDCFEIEALLLEKEQSAAMTAMSRASKVMESMSQYDAINDALESLHKEIELTVTWSKWDRHQKDPKTSFIDDFSSSLTWFF